MALKSAGRLLKEQISERQVPLPAAAQAFHFSNRTWKHVARWWNRVERETLGQGWFKYHFYLLDFRFILCKKKQMTVQIFLSTEDLLTASVSFDYRLFNHSQLNGSYPPRMTFELHFMAGHLVHLELAAFPQSEVVCNCFFLCDSATQGLSSQI